MSVTIEYQDCLTAFSETVSAATAFISSIFLEESIPRAKDSEQPTLVESLRVFYSNNLKPLYDSGKADKDLQRELGEAYGALITHLLAAHSSWSRYKSANNRQIDLKSESRNHAARASAAARACLDSTTNSVLQLMREDFLFQANAQTFMKLVEQFIEQNRWSSCWVSLGRSTRSEVDITCLQFSGSDAYGAPLGVLFDTDWKRQHLRSFAQIAFGGPVKFDSDFGKLTLVG
ncbi:MAG: hypothetical protein SGJ27_22520 [Candidatus Melainabacteria bacterium]|nr:hypothetical protein [Candidatus Melainabacteria bacterium]